jgi:hypothetical protein
LQFGGATHHVTHEKDFDETADQGTGENAAANRQPARPVRHELRGIGHGGALQRTVIVEISLNGGWSATAHTLATLP